MSDFDQEVRQYRDKNFDGMVRQVLLTVLSVCAIGFEIWIFLDTKNPMTIQLCAAIGFFFSALLASYWFALVIRSAIDYAQASSRVEERNRVKAKTAVDVAKASGL